MHDEPNAAAGAGETAAVTLPAVLDIGTVPALRPGLLRELESASGSGFWVDGVERIDGVGLGLIAELRDLSHRGFIGSWRCGGFRRRSII